MRIIHTTGGLELGPPEGPWIDIFAVPPRPVTLAEAERAVEDIQEPLEWHAWREMAQMLRSAGVDNDDLAKSGVVAKGMRGVIGAGPVNVRFLWPKRQNPLLALYQIEEHEGSLSPAIAGACLAASQARQLPTLAPMVVARACGLQPAGDARTRLNRRQIDGFVDDYLETLVRGQTPYAPASSVDRARFWLAVAQQLWQPDVRRRIARSTPAQEHELAAASLAATWLELANVDRIEVAGTPVQIPREAVAAAWFQALEWEADDISAEALRYLVNNTMPGSQEFSTAEMTQADADLCRGLASALVPDAPHS